MNRTDFRAEIVNDEEGSWFIKILCGNCPIPVFVRVENPDYVLTLADVLREAYRDCLGE